ncbi:MAG: ABC transporter ATP-binding protein [Candidatus Methanomethylicota archaeon]|uniref:ABC transporter ATP-binding protein n=1 Tax=Thermoproteota archaeon TaxID=2056631 RepID=A0A520KE56_9CREN|nr:MAG: ABC transporter ATP-binding protein [Candidatus Verstraetearchaeota archaeon]TDA38914.1 MAG: ABC transporter ATP-binding protein [Candidatus Verstraetearchaeota archaeon]
MIFLSFVEYAIEISGLTKKFGDFIAVDHLDLKVYKGEIFGLLGPNGAGKTTTIRMLCGLMAPTEGSIKILGYNIPEQRNEAIRKIGYMAQRFSLYEDLTVYENMEFYGRLYGLKGSLLRERILKLLDFLELSEFKDRLAGKLSGGMKQRLALGVALIHNPSLLILDEPTAGVDPSLRRAFWNYFRSLNKEGTTILVTTHYMDEAENCDRIGLMSKGKLIAIGSPRELKRKAFGGDVIELKIKGDIDSLPLKILETRKENDITIVRAVLNDISKELPNIFNLLDSYNIKLISVEPINISLEEVFIKLLGEIP